MSINKQITTKANNLRYDGGLDDGGLYYIEITLLVSM